MKTYIALIVGGLCLVLFWLTGCTDAPSQCGGEPLAVVQSKITTPYKVVYADLPRHLRGVTMKLPDGAALVVIDQNQNRISRDGALSHELACHVLYDVKHPSRPIPGNVARPDRGAYWDRLKMGAP